MPNSGTIVKLIYNANATGSAYNFKCIQLVVQVMEYKAAGVSGSDTGGVAVYVDDWVHGYVYSLTCPAPQAQQWRAWACFGLPQAVQRLNCM